LFLGISTAFSLNLGILDQPRENKFFNILQGERSPGMRTGIFGGTFNPIHQAHLRIAEEVREKCALDRVIFVPAASPPHKRVSDDVSFAHRLAMVELAVADHPQFLVSDLESCRGGKSYSVHTLEIFRESNPNDELFFIIGMDSFRDLASWKDYERLFGLAQLVVVSRPGVEVGTPAELLPVAIKEQFCYDQAPNQLRHQSGHRVIFLQDTYLDISSSRIRQLVAAERSIRYLVPSEVADYIIRNRLYRNGERS